MSRGMIQIATASLIVATAQGAESPSPTNSAAFPAISLDRLEPAVAKQLESVQSLLAEVIGKPGATDQQRADAFGEFGRLLHAYGYLAEAARCYHQATTYQPKDPRWWHLLGCAREAAGTLAEATAAFTEAQRLGGFPATRIRHGNVLIQLNRRDEARRLFQEVIAKDSKQAAAYAGLGTLALEERDFKAAVDYLSQAVQLAPAANRLQYSLAMAYRGAGDLDRARQHLRLRGDVGLRPQDPLTDDLPELIKGAQVHLLRGRVALAAGAVTDAIREYRQAIEAAPDNVTARVNLAVALVQTQAYDEAIPHLKVAVQLDPRNAAALFNLASLRHAKGEFNESIELLRKLLRIEPRDLAARRLLGQSLVGAGKPGDALALLKESHQIAPDDEDVLLQLAELLHGQNQQDQALVLLNQAHAAHPDRGLTAHALARQLATCAAPKLRDGARALKLAKVVHDASPNFEHTETLALALAATGRFEEAIRLQKQLLAAAEKQGAAATAERVRGNLKRFEMQEPGQ